MEKKFHPKERLMTILALGIQTRRPCLLVGRPGAGKSTTIRLIGKQLGMHSFVLPCPGKRDPAQVVGLPRESEYEGEKVTAWIPYKWIVDLQKKAPSLLGLDDIAEVSRDMQSFFLELVYDRVLGDVFLENTSIVGAANPVRGSLEMTEALNNRMIHLPWDISPEEHGRHLRAGFPEISVPKLPDDWKKFVDPWRDMVGSFFEKIPDYNQADADRAPTDEEGAFLSQRTADYAIDMLAAMDACGIMDKETRKLAVDGCIGAHSANAFFTFCVYGDEIPPVEAVLADPRSLKKKNVYNRPDKCWIVVTTVTRHALFKGDRDTWLQAWNVLAAYAENEKSDYAASCARVLDRHRPEGCKDDPPAMGHFRRVLGRTN